MKSVIIIWLLAVLACVSLVVMVDRYIDGNVNGNSLYEVYEGTDELPNKLRVIRNYGLVYTLDPQQAGKNE